MSTKSLLTVLLISLMACAGLGTTVAASDIPAAASKPVDDVKADPQIRMLRGSGVVIAPPKDTGIKNAAGSTFRFEDAPVVDVVRLVLGDILKVDYVLHPPIAGTVTMATRAEVPADQAVMLLEGALQANGLLMARDARGVYHVGKPEALKTIVAAPRQAIGSGPLPPGYGAIIVPLEYIGAAEMAAILRPMLPSDALLRVDIVRNLLILSGTRTQAEGWLAMVSTFDVDMLKGMSVGVFPLKYASVKEVETALNLMNASVGAGAPAAGVAPNTAGSGVLATGSPAASTASAASGGISIGAIRVLPIERINSILVVTANAKYLDEAKKWIERLDQPSNNGEPQLFVYPVQNGSAKHLAAVLNGLFGSGGGASTASTSTGVAPGLTSAAGSTGGFNSSQSTFSSLINGASGGQAAGRPGTGTGVTAVNLGLGPKVIADEINNAILIYGDRRDYLKIESALRRLDMSPTQVLIEATIIEVSLNDELKYGLQWTFNDNRQGSSFTGTGVLSGNAGGTLGGALAGFSYTLSNVAGVRAVLNALTGKTLVKVISSPSLMVLDNHTATIAVGNQQPVQSGTTITTGGVTSQSIVYKDTGVSLAVTPSVNAGNVVSMQIEQSVTDVGAIDAATLQRAFLNRKISSKVAVRSGEAVVLGGLIRDNTSSGKSGLPGLQDLPFIGNFFGTNTRNTDRTELLVMLTPRVIRSDQDAREVSSELRERMKSFVPLEKTQPTVTP